MSTKSMSSKGSLRPVVGGFYPDPTVCRVGDTYYLAHSSFEFFPGVPLWESTDLLHWEQVANVLTRPEQFPPGEAASSQGVYAPTLRHHDGLFWMITTNVSRPGDHIAYWADDPRGDWSDPITLPGLGGIDPDMAWDESGNCYITYCTSQPGHPEISQVKVDLHAGSILESPRVVWNGTGLQWPEGPHLYQVGDWWYLLIAEGGTERGHTISVARAATPEGPFEGYPGNPLYTHRSTDHPVFSVGHGDLVQAADGTWAMVYLGVRPHGAIPGYHVNGRETFLAGITWDAGWPVVNEDHFAVPRLDNSFHDDFAYPFHPRWSSPGMAFKDFAVAGAKGLTLQSKVAPNGAPSGVSTHVRDQRWQFQTEVLTDGSPALRLRQDESHWYELGVCDTVAYAHLQIGPASKRVERSVSGPSATLQIHTEDSQFGGPDDVILTVIDQSGPAVQLRADGRYLSTEVAGGFIGRVLMLHSTEGSSQFLSATYESIEP